FPCRTENGNVKVIEEIKHNEFGHQKLQVTLNELREEFNAVKELGLIRD
ncbi:MAG: malate dehydrogenase, partial [Coxiella endosymbiont of Haemaphysalis qinghaiensis]